MFIKKGVKIDGMHLVKNWGDKSSKLCITLQTELVNKRHSREKLKNVLVWKP